MNPPFTVNQKKQEYQAYPQKIFEILATPQKTIPILYIDPKCIEMTPKTSPVGLNSILFLYIHTILNNLHNQWARIWQ